jgi:hypothetical protein
MNGRPKENLRSWTWVPSESVGGVSRRGKQRFLDLRSLRRTRDGSLHGVCAQSLPPIFGRVPLRKLQPLLARRPRMSARPNPRARQKRRRRRSLKNHHLARNRLRRRALSLGSEKLLEAGSGPPLYGISWAKKRNNPLLGQLPRMRKPGSYRQCQRKLSLGLIALLIRPKRRRVLRHDSPHQSLFFHDRRGMIR